MSFDSKESSLPPRKKGKKMKQRIKANNQLLLNMELRSRIELEQPFYSIFRVMETKFCPKCNQVLGLDQFSLKGKTYCHKCKGCQRLYSKQHYQSNRSKHIEKVIKYKEKVKSFIRQYKTEHPCTDCGKHYHFCIMDFDHLDSTKKSFNIGNTEHHTFPQVLEEIKKCELVCSNCHRFRTWNRIQSPQ